MVLEPMLVKDYFLHVELWMLVGVGVQLRNLQSDLFQILFGLSLVVC